MKKKKEKAESQTLNYNAAQIFVLKRIQNLKDERKLKAFCQTNSLDYNSVITFSTKKEYHAPLLIKDLFKAFGFEVEMEKNVTYTIKGNLN